MSCKLTLGKGVYLRATSVGGGPVRYALPRALNTYDNGGTWEVRDGGSNTAVFIGGLASQAAARAKLDLITAALEGNMYPSMWFAGTTSDDASWSPYMVSVVQSGGNWFAKVDGTSIQITASQATQAAAEADLDALMTDISLDPTTL